jgi:hypothetical protein
MFTSKFYEIVNFIILTIYVYIGIVMIPNLILTHELKTIIEIQKFDMTYEEYLMCPSITLFSHLLRYVQNYQRR